jgi:predicted P-loop ATPase
MAEHATQAPEFKRSTHGQIIAGDLDNIRTALGYLNAYATFDEFRREVLIYGRPLEDSDLEGLWVQIQDQYGFRPPLETLRRLIVADARQAAGHPVREYLDRLKWDGRPRLDSWLTDYGGAEDTAYVRAVARLILLAAVRRVRQPGAKFDELAILESEQGRGKSSALRALCPRADWFSDDLPLGVESKQVIERTAGKLIIEAAELHGNRGREAEQLKAFLSRQEDGPCRLAYARMPVSVKRQFVIVGTTNARQGYLKDPTGARRFWPVNVTGFDVAGLTRDKDQLWAEASVREAEGESIRLHESLWTDAAKAQEARRAGDPWEAILEPLFEGDGVTAPMSVPVSAVWDALGLAASHLDNRHADRISAIAQRFGFTRKSKRRIGGARPVWCWTRHDDDDGDDT